MYARIQNGAVTQWPLNETHIQNRGIPPEEARKVQPRLQPAHFEATQYVVERKPSVVDGEPVQTWEVLFHEDAQARAKAAMVAWIDGLTAQIKNFYPEAMREQWKKEEAAARAVKAGTATADQLALVTRDGAAKGRTPEEHADAIIANADRYEAIGDQIRTLFLAADAALEAATDPAQYETILDAAKEQAAPIAQAYGLTT